MNRIGFLIAAGRLNEYDVIHEGLLLRSPYMFLVMGSAVAVARPERKHVLGAMVFGAGWAVAGTCPGPALAMTAGGGLLGVAVIVGIVAGLFLRDAVAERTQPATGEPNRPRTATRARV